MRWERPPSIRALVTILLVPRLERDESSAASANSGQEEGVQTAGTHLTAQVGNWRFRRARRCGIAMRSLTPHFGQNMSS